MCVWGAGPNIFERRRWTITILWSPVSDETWLLCKRIFAPRIESSRAGSTNIWSMRDDLFECPWYEYAFGVTFAGLTLRKLSISPVFSSRFSKICCSL